MNSRFAGHRLIQLLGHRFDFTAALAFSHDGLWVAGGAADGRLHIWQQNSGGLVRTLQAHEASVSAVAFSPGGEWLATGSEAESSVRLWEPSSGELLRALESPDGRGSHLMFSPDGRWLASNSNDSIRLWEPASGALVRTLKDPRDTLIHSFTFSPDGRWLASSSYNSIRLWDAASGTLVRTLEGELGRSASLAFSPDSRCLATSSDGAQVLLWDPSNGTLLRTLELKQGWMTIVAFSPDGRWLATASRDRDVDLWDPFDGRHVRSLGEDNMWVTSLTFSPDGRALATASFTNGVRLWDPSNGECVGTLEARERWVTSLAYSPDGRWLANGARHVGVRLWDPSSGALLRTLEERDSWVTHMAFGPECRWLACGSYDGSVRVWDPSSGTLLQTMKETATWLQDLTVSPDGRWLAAASGGSGVNLWDPSSGALVRTLQMQGSLLIALAFSPDSQWLVTGSYDVGTNSVQLWDLTGGNLVRTLKEQEGARVNTLALSPDGRVVASGSIDGIVRLWLFSNGALMRTLEGHTSRITSLVFSPDSRWLASASDDRTVQVWDLADSKYLLQIAQNLWNKLRGSNAAAAQSLEVHRQHPFDFTDLGLAFVKAPARTEPFADGTILLRAIDDASLSSRSAGSSPGREADAAPTRSTSGKIVLLGESNSGKSSLALRLAEDRYEGQTTTHGMRLWKFPAERLDAAAAAPPGERREVVLWDLGGQDEYRLIHQLFIHDTQIALILLDATRGAAAFDDAREWHLRLERQSKRATKLLVGSKLDDDLVNVDHTAVDLLRNTCGARAFYPASAKTGYGVAALRKALAAELDWNSLGTTSRPALFQRVYDAIEERRRNGDVVVAMDELREQVRQQGTEDFDAAGVDQVVDQLARQGALADTHRSSGERMLVLQLGDIERYAGSVIFAAKQNPRGVPVVDERDLTQPDAVFPRIKPEERLPPSSERVVLECVVQLMVERGICLRQSGLLIFPSLFPFGQSHEITGAETVSLYYDFTGPIDNIYAGLVATAAIAERFGRVRLAADRAEFDLPSQGVCGLRRTARRSGSGHLDLLFSPEIDPETRRLFTVFVEDYLSREGVRVSEVLQLDCISGDYKFDEVTVRQRIEEDKDFVLCPRCEKKTPINTGAVKTRAANPEIERALIALKTNVERRTALRADEARRAVGKIKVFVSYAHADDALRSNLSKHLSTLRREGAMDLWDDRHIEPGTDWAGTIDQRLEEAQVILLLVSPDFMASRYCFDIETRRALARRAAGEATVIPVVIRPVAWQTSEIGSLQALPRDGKAVTTWVNHDEAWLDVANGVRQAVNHLLRSPDSSDAPPIPEEEKSAPRFIVPPRPIRILHLSDLHFTASTDAMQMLQPLVQDIRDPTDGLGFREIDYLVVTGDLTCAGLAEEFERVHQFLGQLFQRFGLSAERCLIVPGNHDLSWETTVYDWQPARKIDPSSLRKGAYLQQGNGFLVRDDEQYPARFENFAKFHHQLTQQPYPLLPEEQLQVFLSERDRIQFIGLNSAWEIDEHFRDRSSINGRALAQALVKADAQVAAAESEQRLAAHAQILRLAVWHHPITGKDTMDSAFVDHVRKAGVQLCLHGHVHEDRAEVLRHLEKRKLHVAGAGSFGAVAKDRPESTPRLFNLIEVMPDRQHARVHTRCMRKESGAWEGWASWPGADGHSRRTYYEIPLAESGDQHEPDVS